MQIDNYKLLNNLNLFKIINIYFEIFFPHIADSEGNFWKHY